MILTVSNFVLGPSNARVVTRRHFFEKMQEQNLPTFEEKLEYLENYVLTYQDYTETQIKDLKHRFSYIKSQFKQRWANAQRNVDNFIKKNNNWLQGTFEQP